MPGQKSIPEYPMLFPSVPDNYVTAEESHELSRAKVVEMQQSKKPGRQILQMVGQEFKKCSIPFLSFEG